MARAGKLIIEVDRAVVFDELLENVADLAELAELVPRWCREEANEIVQRIVDRQKGWIKIEGGLQ